MKQLLLFLLLAVPVYASETVSDPTTNYTPSASTTIADSTVKDHAAGSTLMVGCMVGDDAAGNETVTSVTNTAGDVFVLNTGARRTARDVRVEIWYVLSSAGNATDVIRCTWTGNVGFPVIVTIEVAHTGANSFDVASTSSSEGAAVTSGPVDAFSTSAAGIIMVCAQDGASAAYTAPSGYTLINDGTDDGAFGCSYKAGTESSGTPTTTWTTAAGFAAVAISLKEAGGGGGGITLKTDHLRRLRQ